MDTDINAAQMDVGQSGNTLWYACDRIRCQNFYGYKVNILANVVHKYSSAS